MDREILFRGKRIDNNEWVYGYYLPWHAVTDLQGNEPYAQIFEEHKVKGKYVAKGWVRVNFNTVGQYTGLCDKNGNKIFEGDIVRFYDKDWIASGIATVDFESGRWKINGHYTTKLSSIVWLDLYRKGFEYEVIGNIYDNPELLEVE